LELLDSRRLTGRNLQGPRAGAVAEVGFSEGEDVEAALGVWSAALDRALEALGREVAVRRVRRYVGGASLVLEAPLDALYAATEINEWAVAVASGPAPPLGEAVRRFEQALAEEANPALLALEAEAARRGAPFVWDDDEVSLGMGRRSRTWPSRALPSPEQAPWDDVGSVPAGYVTGTNGKTTTTRMTAAILRAAGRRPGSTSSDGVVVDGEVIERGDWTGAGAARLVLRHPGVDVAVLETARGGLLRRGLVLDGCDAALITNVADDHLGDYGVLDVAGMARAKGLVCQAVRPGGRRILNVDDPLLRGIGERPGPPLCWFGLDPSAAPLRRHVRAGGEAWVLDEGWLVRWQGGVKTPVVEVVELPACHGGAARHNVANALGAAALASALGADPEAVRSGLAGFAGDAGDNPGRCNLQERGGVRILLDFGHNPHGVRAILDMARRMREDAEGGRMSVSLGQAGDRSDDDIRGLVDAVLQAGPDRIILRELAGYERGRASGEVVGLMRGFLADKGWPAKDLSVHPDEVGAMRDALRWARPGDLVVQLVHIERQAVGALLADPQSPAPATSP